MQSDAVSDPRLQVAACWEAGAAGSGSGSGSGTGSGTGSAVTLGAKELGRCLLAVLTSVTSGSGDPRAVVSSLWRQLQSMQIDPALKFHQLRGAFDC